MTKIKCCTLERRNLMKRGGTTDDVANACLFLASDMSSYISGQVLNVCGGMLT
jgi:3-oxoacyl-[acyl-carrier protein] reductase